MEIGVFIPIGSNGWLISTTAPRYRPSWELNKTVVQKAEEYGLDFALSMIKLRGFGGESEFWDHNLESFTLMSALAAVTSKIKLFATVATLTIPPAIVARMASTIDSVAPGRFGINLITGWAKTEYDQMGLWPGEEHYQHRYEMLTEYTTVLQDLWTTGHCDLKGKYFTMNDCVLSPRPSAHIPLVCAGQSPPGLEYTSKFCDYGFVVASGMNEPMAAAAVSAKLAEAAEKAGRDVGTYQLIMVIADETDEAAEAKWRHYVAGADPVALGYLGIQAGGDTNAAEGSTARTIAMANSPINFNMGTYVGSYAKVAALLDQAGSIPGTKGLMLTFDDFVVGMDQFGKYIQPLMQSRKAAA